LAPHSTNVASPPINVASWWRADDCRRVVFCVDSGGAYALLKAGSQLRTVQGVVEVKDIGVGEHHVHPPVGRVEESLGDVSPHDAVCVLSDHHHQFVIVDRIDWGPLGSIEKTA
jgi:hypothetical protein